MLANVLSSSKNGSGVENVSRFVNAKMFTGPCRKPEIESCSNAMYDRLSPLTESNADFRPASLPQNNELELILKGVMTSGASSPPAAATYLGQSPPVRSGAANPMAYSSSWSRDAYAATKSNLQALRELDPTIGCGIGSVLFTPLGASFTASNNAIPTNYPAAMAADDFGFDFMPFSPDPPRRMGSNYGLPSSSACRGGSYSDHASTGMSVAAPYYAFGMNSEFEPASPPMPSYLTPPSPYVNAPVGCGTMVSGTVAWPIHSSNPAGEFHNIPVRGFYPLAPPLDDALDSIKIYH
uniref:Uncharacterized protein n=1 Tax=Polytomella parva TaxID=51329 RepID=A0A7S0YMN3_9CHLO|mmetsp:Transcript_33765/g.60957  ORF Transcript_33765/g.60957 Transcript_33765/m.60957 type:complete len:295 (+) Transcript_33765:117-1001(+)|eukprot:CAMPEP_0175043110 /NCGR_PEP_ID=MMETSP0052_2-20121109/2978_1 /TAXON_ID=51329 ORGANISM="Polytomella parva, Strain SAG 63-3" /NCGR_SAMPLE_ID=MMETSP0052_2 /ASSEMBLY_ACC=CAM_ASM_000194 /LENGTH=294 /DNA_ID=CAMNT_0016306079 /DNA_START=112 /DNA_END=996 /DNA_ORIENTATION=+